jgi:hypothetical protein
MPARQEAADIVDLVTHSDLAGMKEHFSGTLAPKSLTIVWKLGCPTS